MSAQFEPFSLTQELLTSFVQSQIAKGTKRDTIRKYRTSLKQLMDFLPPGKELTPEALEEWRACLKDSGYSNSSVQTRISAVNSLLRFQGYGLVAREPAQEKTVMPVPTREEYIKFLIIVKNSGREQDYLVVKVFASIGLTVSELGLLTVESCQQGFVDLPQKRKAVVPTGLGKELLGFAGRNDIHSGSIFVTRNGVPVDRTNVVHIIHDIAANAGLEPEKFCPSALRRMYLATWNDVQEKMMPLCLQAYNNLLDTEQAMISARTR